MFFVVDGPDGSGKTTVMDFLASYFAERNIPHVVTREPGGSDLGEVLRASLIDPQYDISGTTELLLFSTIRSHHIEKTIRPALAAGKFVLCSRYVASTYALQIASGADPLEVEAVVGVSTKGFLPDLTIVLDVPVETTVERVGTRDFIDRIELKGLEYHQKVRENFLTYVEANPNRCVLIDGTQTREAVQQEITQAIESAICDRTHYTLSPEDIECFESNIEESPIAEILMTRLNANASWK